MTIDSNRSVPCPDCIAFFSWMQTTKLLYFMMDLRPNADFVVNFKLLICGKILP